MTTGLGNVLAALEGTGVDVTAREVAEALWLATYIAEPEGTATPGPVQASAAGSDKPERVPIPRRAVRPGTPAALHAATAAAATAKAGSGALRAITVGVADAPALAHELDLVRALRPFKRQVPSQHRRLLDETATAERSAEQRLFLPETRPEPERWLSLALVMESGPTMTVWHSLVGELTALLQRTGAFRDIRLWHLHAAPDGSPGLYPRAIPTSALRSPREIIDPTGRQAIWWVSDCTSSLWHDGHADRLMELWGHSSPLAVIQPLPQRLWRRTGLRPERVRLHAGMPGIPNSQLRATWSGTSALLRGPAAGIPVPVLELDPSWLSAWTRLVTATGPGGVPAVATMTDATRDATSTSDRDGSSAEVPPDDPLGLVRSFRAHASPQAYRLAGCLATVTLTLPVMRLVQRVMLPESRPAHLAEFLLSGLLRHAQPDSSRPEYEFVEGVRDVLQSTVRYSDTRRVHAEVSAYLAAHAGDAGGTQALAVLPSGQGDVTVAGSSRSFAEITLRGESHMSRSDPGSASPPADPDLPRTGTRSIRVPARVNRSPERVRNELIIRIVDALQFSATVQQHSSRDLWRQMLEEELATPVEPFYGERFRPWLLELVKTSTRSGDGLACVVRALEYVEQASSAVDTLWPLVDEWEAVEFFGNADLEDLRPALESLSSFNLSSMVRRASRSRVQELPRWCQTAWHVFLRLAGVNSPERELPPSMAFLALAADRLVEENQAEAAEVLRRFNRDNAMSWGLESLLADWQYSEFPEQTPSLHPAYLLVEFQPDAVEANDYHVSHWRQSDPAGWHPVPGESHVVAREGLRAGVEHLIEETEERWADLRQPVILEFILPWELLNEPVEWWSKESDSPYPTPLALDYPVVVRSLERMRRVAWHRPWHNKWRQLKEHPEQCHAHWSEPSPDGTRFFRLERDLKEDRGAVCLILSEPPTEPSSSGRREVLAGLRAGVPMMLWHRQDCTDPAFRAAVSEILAGRTLHGMVEQVAKLRREALALGPERWEGHIGHHLTILFDDAERKPGPRGPV